MFIDEVELKFTGGHGGAGKMSFYPGMKSGPDGGNGGKGGDVYVEAVQDLFALNQFSHKKELAAENGSPGDKNRMSGKNGGDLYIKLPVGTLIVDKQTGERIELMTEGERVLICRGGIGGRGNFELKSPRRTTPMFAQKGLPGQARELAVNLRLIADFGLIGLPNAGKSSLLNEITSANAKIGDYPFTTLEPNLGAFEGRIIADIPGLIEGASEGKGLGHRFLKHIEKVRLLLHCISADSLDPLGEYKVIRDELKKFDPILIKKKEIIILTKIDMIDEAKRKTLIELLSTTKKKVYPVSIYDFDSIEQIKKVLKKVK